MMNYPWPGNIRELQNILDRGNILEVDDYGALIRQHKSLMEGNESLSDDRLETVKKFHIRRILDKFDGNKDRASKALDITVNTLKKYL